MRITTLRAIQHELIRNGIDVPDALDDAIADEIMRDAAPDMLAALEETRSELRDATREGVPLTGRQQREMVLHIDAAITKARGS